MTSLLQKDSVTLRCVWRLLVQNAIGVDVVELELDLQVITNFKQLALDLLYQYYIRRLFLLISRDKHMHY